MSTPSISAPLLSGPADLKAPSKPSKIHEAAQQFEALMVGEMMKTARESGSEGGWLGSGESTGDDSAIGMAESQFSQALASRGGFGLAKMIEQTVARQQAGVQEKNATPGTTLPGAH